MQTKSYWHASNKYAWCWRGKVTIQFVYADITNNYVCMTTYKRILLKKETKAWKMVWCNIGWTKSIINKKGKAPLMEWKSPGD